MKKLFMILVLLSLVFGDNIDEAKKVYYAKDFKKALSMFEELSKSGNVEANYYLGTMYGFPYGVKQDYKKAFEYYTIAANRSNKRRFKSIFNIALFYSEGRGVKEDNKKAFNLFKILDKENIGVAQYMMGRMYSEGKGVEQNTHKAIEYLEKACNNKVSEACYDSGYFYEQAMDLDAEGIYPIAKEFYEKGCELGSKESCEAIKNMKEPLLSLYKKYYWYILLPLLLLSWWRIWDAKKNKKGYYSSPTRNSKPPRQKQD